MVSPSRPGQRPRAPSVGNEQVTVMNSPTFTSTKPTCTLEVSATPSPLTQWSDRQLVTDVAFRLTLEPTPTVLAPNSLPGGTEVSPSEQVITNLQGDGAQLQALTTVVETYVQKILAGQITEADIVDEVDDTVEPESTEPMQVPVTTLLKQFESSYNAEQISLQPKNLVSHQLNLGSLRDNATGKMVILTATQLFDLTAALTDWSQQMALLPRTEPSRGFKLSKLPIWVKSSALAAVVLGASALALQWFHSGSLGPVATEPNPEAPTQTAQAPNLPPLRAPNARPTTASPNPTASPSPLTARPKPTAKPSPGQSPGTPNSPLAALPTANPSSPVVSLPAPNPNSASPPPITYLPRSQGGGLLSPLTSPTGQPRRSQPATRPASPQTTTAQPQPTPLGNNVPLQRQVENAPSSPPPVAFAPPPPAFELPPAAPPPSAPPAAPPPSAPAPPAAIPRPGSASAPITRPNSGFAADSARPVTRAIAPPSSAPVARPTSQVREVRDYFAQRWQPPAGLTQNLEYSLLLNPNGSLRQITPIDQTAKVFLERTPIPLNTSPIASPMTSATQVRLVLQKNGQVQVRLEAPGR
jgi:hypothetical protein